MTATIWVHHEGDDMYGDCALTPGERCRWRWFFTTETRETALAIATAAHPDAPPLTAKVIIGCDVKSCWIRLVFPHSPGIGHARQAAARWNGWFTVPGKGLQDLCQLHCCARCHQGLPHYMSPAECAAQAEPEPQTALF